MSQAPYMPLFLDAYLGDTMHLSLEEHGAYLKLLMVTWRRNGEPLPDDDNEISRYLGIQASHWRKRLRRVIGPFFDLSDGTWRQKRLECEWQAAQHRIARSQRNGRSGGRPKTQTITQKKPGGFPPGNPDRTQDQTQSEPAPNLQPNPDRTQTKANQSQSQKVRSNADALSTDEPVPTPPPDLKLAVFGNGLSWLIEVSGRPERQLRSLLGRWCSSYGDAAVLQAFSAAARSPPAGDPVEFLIAILQQRGPNARNQPVDLHGIAADIHAVVAPELDLRRAAADGGDA